MTTYPAKRNPPKHLYIYGLLGPRPENFKEDARKLSTLLFKKQDKKVVSYFINHNRNQIKIIL